MRFITLFLALSFAARAQESPPPVAAVASPAFDYLKAPPDENAVQRGKGAMLLTLGSIMIPISASLLGTSRETLNKQLHAWQSEGLITLEPGVDGPGTKAKIQALVDEVNRELSRYEQIKRFSILPRDFAIEEGELTPTLKLKRRICEQHFAAEIDALYA